MATTLSDRLRAELSAIRKIANILAKIPSKDTRLRVLAAVQEEIAAEDSGPPQE